MRRADHTAAVDGTAAPQVQRTTGPGRRVTVASLGRIREGQFTPRKSLHDTSASARPHPPPGIDHLCRCRAVTGTAPYCVTCSTCLSNRSAHHNHNDGSSDDDYNDNRGTNHNYNHNDGSSDDNNNDDNPTANDHNNNRGANDDHDDDN